jgi:group I intron endonuclease
MIQCGIYQILCRVTGKCYVGSSRNIEKRWTAHRYSLRAGKNGCWRLQLSWTKHGEDAFQFSILEECLTSQLFTREQFYIDQLQPALNVVRDVKARISELAIEANRVRWAAITHCPHGHEFTKTNTYVDRKGSRICKRCNSDRVNKVYNSETPEQRAERHKRSMELYWQNYERRRAVASEYAKATRAAKREYDRLHLKEKRERRRRALAVETPEARAHRLMLKRESYYRCKGNYDAPLVQGVARAEETP